jgi:phenylalanyl-tRNA synthetase beta chain
MKFAYQHLLRFLVDKPSIDDLSEKLFQLGHEHEIEDSIFNMEFTPNRGDCLSLIGLARDLNVFYQTDINPPIYNNDLGHLDLNFINNAEDDCPTISFLNIHIDGEILPYKEYLENYFVDLKINKNNFFTDISNYIGYEMGQPTHSYDFSLMNNEIALGLTKESSDFKTLLGNTLNLDTNELVFTSNNNIINLAGIVGGMKTSCSKETKNVLIECAFFRPESIIGKAVKYDTHSDASHKFERSVDPLCHEKVLRRFIQIVSDHASITKVEFVLNSYKEFQDKELELNIEKVNNILGLTETSEDFTKYLSKLGFIIDKTIKVPSFRSDVRTQNDLAEELARVIGYDNIPIKSINIPNILDSINNKTDKEIKIFLINNGFSEVINSSFCNRNEKNSIAVDNPLDSNRQFIRSNISNSLLENLVFNEKRQKDIIKLFEISDLYTQENEIKSIKKLAIIISGRRGHNHINFSESLNREYLIDLFKELDINIENEIISINRDKVDSKIKTPIFSVEISLDRFKEKLTKHEDIAEKGMSFVQYKPVSDFPTSFRDFSFSIKDASEINKVKAQLDNASSEYLIKSFTFDIYKNTKTNETKLGQRFIFQASNKTLTDKEIDLSLENILESVLKIDSVFLPGRD